jgi:hypothetical protein
MDNSTQHIVGLLERKIDDVLLFQLPKPSCKAKLQQWEWKRAQVKQMLAQRLGGGMGINVNVNVQ